MNKTNQMFNLMKLPEYTPLFKGKKVAVAGVGAVGSHLVQILAMMGVGEIWCFDFDHFEKDNISKCSGMVDPDANVGTAKARAVAEQAQRRMVEGGRCHGIHGDLRNYGPMAFAGFDAVFIALDNYAAKELVNQTVLQIPAPQRPIVGMAGTSGESAVAVLMNGEDFCLRCLFDESWLENADARTSCSGPQYMQLEGVAQEVRTSGLASLIAAAILAEKFRAWVLGDPNVMNTRSTYTPYPNLELLDTAPMRRSSCPDCRSIQAPAHVLQLSGSVLELTLEDALRQIGTQLDSRDFALQVHVMRFAELSYGGFITSEFCHHCGEQMEVYAHESRVHFEDVLCDGCRAADRSAYYDPDRPVGSVLRRFRSDTTDQRLLGMTLYELGYPLGAYLYVTCRDGAQQPKYFCFTCAGDPEMLVKCDKL